MTAPKYRIVVGITGGIAAYKAVSLVRAFVQDGHHVDVIATDAALQFIGRPTLEAISRNPVHTGLYDEVASVRHVALGQQAGLIVVAPATANFIGQTAAGLAPDLLANTVIARRGPLLIAPAMHTEMWQNPAVMHNIEQLRSRGVFVIGPATGALTGTDEGIGRMSEIEDIVTESYRILGSSRTGVSAGVSDHLQKNLGDLSGLKILISGGGTREHLDPVRFIGNESSGKQAVALAARAAERGAHVTLVHAHIDVPVPWGVVEVSADTAQSLHQEMSKQLPSADVVIMAAAVADYRPEVVSGVKIKRESAGKQLSLTLIENDDILVSLVQQSKKLARKPLIVGFAAETVSKETDLISIGRAKIARKGCDLLVLNSVDGGKVFGSDSNSVIVLNSQGDILGTSQGSKLSVADAILDVAQQALPHQNA